MTESNPRTIEAYQAHVQEYIDGTPQEVSGVVKVWIDAALADLPKDANILEFGSAFGRDAEYLQDKGFSVQCTDATPAFVDLLRQKGFDAHQLDAITDDIGGPYNLVLANAVLLHFSRPETEQVLHKVRNALRDGGRFAFTLKEGEGEGWSEKKLGAPRYFCYWTEGQTAELLEKVGFSKLNISGDNAGKDATWLQIIARK